MKNAALILVKPDAVSKGLTGDVLKRLDLSGLKCVAAKQVYVSRDLAQEHYRHIKGTRFYEGVLKFLTGELHEGAPVMAMVYQGPRAIKTLRALAGATNPEEAAPTSIRGAYGRITTQDIFENVLHVSSSQDDAEREIKLWFGPEELPQNMVFQKMIKTEQQQRRVWA